MRRLVVVFSSFVLIVAACGSSGGAGDGGPVNNVRDRAVTTSLPPVDEAKSTTATGVTASAPSSQISSSELSPPMGPGTAGISFPQWGPPVPLESPQPNLDSALRDLHFSLWKPSTASSAGLVIVDMTPREADFAAATTVWFSPDAVVWEPADLITGVRMSAVADSGPGFVAVGHADSNTIGLETDAGPLPYPVPAVWTSDEGRVWTSADIIESAPFQYGELHDVAVTDSGLIAAGQVWDAETLSSPAVWSSPDGLNWKLQPGDPLALTLERADQMLMKVVAGPGGFVAAGMTLPASSDAPGPIITWWSQDGVSWAPSPVGPDSFPIATSLSELVAFGSGFVMGGFEPSVGPLVWFSADGRAWDEPIVLPTRSETDSSFLTGLATDGSIVVALGDEVVLDDGLGPATGSLSIWMSSNGVDWVKPPPGVLEGSAVLDTVQPGSVLSFRGDWVVFGTTRSYSEEVPKGLVWFGQ